MGLYSTRCQRKGARCGQRAAHVLDRTAGGDDVGDEVQLNAGREVHPEPALPKCEHSIRHDTWQTVVQAANLLSDRCCSFAYASERAVWRAVREVL